MHDPAEPQTLTDALSSPDAPFWTEAVEDEMKSLAENNTWQLVELPPGVKPITAKWVFKIKRDGEGRVIRYKARLVARGFEQVEGVDYNETFAPVTKYSTTRSVLAFAAANDLHVHQVDIKTAFLQGTLEEEVYMVQPEGFDDGTGRVCLLKKSLYGLKQAPRVWHDHMEKELLNMGFAVSDADRSLYVGYTSDGTAVYLVVYVDDMLVVSKRLSLVDGVKLELLSLFDGRDLGEVKDFVGMRVTRDWSKGTITISNERLVADLLSKFNMGSANGRQVPMSPGIDLVKDEDDILDVKRYPYSALVGGLLYLAVTVRPDIAFSVGVLSRFMSNPGMSHWNAAKGVLRYLAATPKLGITYSKDRFIAEVQGWCDADFAGDRDTRKSTSGYVFTISGGAVSWSSKRQSTVSVSTTEAEYKAAFAAGKEAVWLRKLADDFCMPAGPMHIKCDSTGALALLHNDVVSDRSKHFDVQVKWVRERVSLGELGFSYIPTADMAADMLTKAVPPAKHKLCCSMIGMCASDRAVAV